MVCSVTLWVSVPPLSSKVVTNKAQNFTVTDLMTTLVVLVLPAWRSEIQNYIIYYASYLYYLILALPYFNSFSAFIFAPELLLTKKQKHNICKNSWMLLDAHKVFFKHFDDYLNPGIIKNGSYRMEFCFCKSPRKKESTIEKVRSQKITKQIHPICSKLWRQGARLFLSELRASSIPPQHFKFEW